MLLPITTRQQSAKLNASLLNEMCDMIGCKKRITCGIAWDSFIQQRACAGESEDDDDDEEAARHRSKRPRLGVDRSQAAVCILISFSWELPGHWFCIKPFCTSVAFEHILLLAFDIIYGKTFICRL